MLSGALPFRMALPNKCPRYAIVAQRGVRLLCEANSFSEDATALLSAMLDPNPSTRISAAEILTSAWAAPVTAPPAHVQPLAVFGLSKWCELHTDGMVGASPAS